MAQSISTGPTQFRRATVPVIDNQPLLIAMLFSSLLFHVFVATATLAIPTTGEQGTHQAADTALLKPVQPAPDAAATTVPAASTVAQDQTTDNWAGVALTFGPVSNLWWSEPATLSMLTSTTVQGAVVNTETEPASRFLDEQHWRGHRR